MKAVKKDKKEIIWVLIYTKAKQEIKANENLQNQGFKTFLPLISATNKNSESKSLVPVFPRYIFAQINFGLDNWTSIKSSYGVSYIVMFGDKFTSVSPRIIKLIQDRLNEEGIYKENVSRVDYKKGDSLTIKEGQFAGIDAIFLSKKSKDRVRLLLKLINTTVISEISESDIGHKEVVKNFKF
jgi:transcriptional antiterminator RfaH